MLIICNTKYYISYKIQQDTLCNLYNKRLEIFRIQTLLYYKDKHISPSAYVLISTIRTNFTLSDFTHEISMFTVYGIYFD